VFPVWTAKGAIRPLLKYDAAGNGRQRTTFGGVDLRQQSVDLREQIVKIRAGTTINCDLGTAASAMLTQKEA
jgi:hypothetical protein